jgi:hypothetical protein
MYCPFCGKELRTSSAKRCRHCHAAWHSTGAVLPDPWRDTPEQRRIVSRLERMRQLEQSASLSRLMIIKLGLTTSIAVVFALVTLVVSALSLAHYGTSIFSGSQLLALYASLVIGLLSYAALTLRYMPSGVAGVAYLLRHSAASIKAKSIGASLRFTPTSALSPKSTGVTTRPHAAPDFDVFLSHNSRDKDIVRELSNLLTARGLRVWLDERGIAPGRPWQTVLERTIQTAPTAAILIGREGIGPWQQPEIWACLTELVERQMPVIPILLPGAGASNELPLFLKTLSWVDLRNGLTPAAIDMVQWGITGIRPLTHSPPLDGSRPSHK